MTSRNSTFKQMVITIALLFFVNASSGSKISEKNKTSSVEVYTDVKVGTMNVESMSGDTAHITATCQNIPKDLHVLALQEVFLDGNEEMVKKLLAKDYPYQYAVPKQQSARAGCKATSNAVLEAFNQCLVKNNVPYVFYHTIVPCMDQLLRLMDEDYECAECFLAVAVDGGKDSKEHCMANQGYKYVFGGSTGMMVLSKTPIYHTMFEEYPSFMQRMGLLTFCVDGILYGVSHWSFNWTYTTETGHKRWVSLKQYSQADMAVNLLTRRPSIFMGDLNSGPGYQEEGYNILVQEGYEDVAPGVATFCPDLFAPQCIHEQEKQLPLDHIFVDSEISKHHLVWKDRNYTPSTFAIPPNQSSDHVGLRVQISHMKVREHPYCSLPPLPK